MPILEIHGSADRIIPANITIFNKGPSGSVESVDGYV